MALKRRRSQEAIRYSVTDSSERESDGLLQTGTQLASRDVHSGLFAGVAQHITRRFGTFDILVTNAGLTGTEHVVLVRGAVGGKQGVLCRVSSACVTSTALDSAECDCSQQLTAALRMIHTAELGVLIYLDQEGRGHGLTTKIRALRHKNAGLDTFQAVEALGLLSDIRTYEVVDDILRALRVQSISLLTCNPDKAKGISEAGVNVRNVVPLRVSVPVTARRHMLAKRARGHLL